MANTSISNLAAGAAVAATDLLPNVQTAGVGPVKTTAAQLKTYMNASPVITGGAQLNGSSSGSVTVLSPAAPTTWSLTLPTAVPSVAGQLLSSTTGGVASWTSGLTYDANGLGLGAASDGSKLYISQNQNAYTTAKISNTTVGTSSLSRLLLLSDTAYLNLAATSSAYTDIPGAASAILFGINFASGGMQFSITGAATTLRFDANSNLVLGSAAIATSATNGFLYVTGCAGTPTGVPTAYTGRVPLVVDTTNNKLYFYSGGAWRDAGP